jgi:DNA/RNA endonuclease YhcR with UshA esterase domain
MLHAYPSEILKIILLRASIVAQALTLIVFPTLAAVSYAQTNVISIAEARGLSPGTVVKVEGTVTVPSGAFKSSISDEGFAVQDSSAGIYVSMSVNARLRVRQQVRVTGKLAESNGMLVVAASDVGSVEARGRGPETQAAIIATGHVGETTEGRLVKVTGSITRPVGDDAPYGFRIVLDDGTGEIQVFVSTSTGIKRRGLRMGKRIRVTGLSGQYKDHYEINPRFQADIKVIP